MKDALGEDIEIGDLIIELYRGYTLYYRVVGFSPKQVRALSLGAHGTYHPRTKTQTVYSKNVVKVNLEQFTRAYIHAGGNENNIDIFLEHTEQI